MQKWARFGLLSLLILLVPAVCAAGASFGDVADNLMKPTELITKVVMVICYIVGVALLLTALAQYKMHRQNPKLVPLSTPVVLVILGVLALLIPYGTTMLGPTFSAEESAKGRSKPRNALPVPDPDNHDALLPLPKRDTGARQTRPERRDAPPPPPAQKPRKGGGHWSDDAQYR